MDAMLNQSALDTLFYNAHTHNGWQDRPVDDAVLQQLHDALRWAPTAANGAPARLVFVRSAARPGLRRRCRKAIWPRPWPRPSP
jgi:nitroreductase